MWSEEYIPILERWGFKITEVPQEPADYLLGEKLWVIERGKKTKATIVVYAFQGEQDGAHINFVPVCLFEFYRNAIAGARRAFDKIVARLVVSATIQRHVRYKPYFIRNLGFIKNLGRIEVKFQFKFEKNKWRWLAWVCTNFKWSEAPYEFAGAPEIDPIASFPSFEKAVLFELLV
jgi:hypothetical protein